MIKNAFILIIILLSGCSHTSKRERIDEKTAPPAEDWIAEIKKADPASLSPDSSLTESQNWWITYKRALHFAKINPQKSCEDFTSLHQEKDFPLWDLAYVRSQEVCTQADPEFHNSPIAHHRWYQPLLVPIREKYARKTADLHDDIEILIEKSKQETQPKKKEKLIVDAYNLAKKTQDKELITTVHKRLVQIFPKHLENPPKKLWLEVAQDFRQFRDFEKAESFYHKVIKKSDDPEEQWSAWKGLRQIQKTKQDKVATLAMDKKIQSWFKKILKKNKGPIWIKRWHDHSLMEIRQLWTEDKYQLAYKKLQNAAITFKDIYPRDEIYFLLSRMQEEKSLYDKAQESLSLAKEEKESSGDLREKILWSSAWLFYKQNNYKNSLERLNEALDLKLDPSSRYKYLFWKARAQKNLSLPEATLTYNLLNKEDPLGIYGVLAYYDLNKSLPPLKSSTHEKIELRLRSVPEISSLSGLKMDWLISLEETDILEESLKNTLEDLKSIKNISEKSWLKFFSAFAQAKLYLPLFSNLNKINSETRDHLLKSHPELIFGRPFDEFVLPVAKKTGVSPWLIYSIMRQESAFDPEARSQVDALGLLQLMPALAKNLAKTNKIPFHQAEDLFEPKIGIQLGTLELKNLMDRYNGNFILAVAAYNANGNAIKGWIKTRFRGDPIEFIEEIPYEETRAYIKLVLRNYVFYERLNLASQEVKFPASLLKWPPDMKQKKGATKDLL